MPEGVAPIAYDLTLELDPERASFTGRVAITIAVTEPTARLWLNAVDLEISRAMLRASGRDEPVTPVAADHQLVGFALPRAVGPGTVVLAIEYAGRVADLSRHAGKDEQGMFRERTGGRWYLYSQAESVFARRIAPCFDEPRFKPAWRVTVVVPRDQVALGNAPVAAERVLPDGRREVRFAEIAALPSYLFAVAVGPFERVDGGRLGRGRIPVRFAVAAGDGRQVAAASRALPRIVDALEGYVGAPLPLAKLDLVAVPEFFGAMENPGLVTFQAAILTGRGDFVPVAAHELAHQWFGDAVTPAWWDHLWLSEAFASWLGERVTTALGAARPTAIAHLDRLQALEADDAIDARPLLRTIKTADEVEPAFDAIAYDKGAAVLAMFERFVGADAFQAAVRRYLAAHAGTAVTTEMFLAALGAATRPEVADALAANLRHAGTPVVELALRCAAAREASSAGAAGPGAASVATVVASVRDGVTVPVCLHYPVAPGGTARACFLAGARTEQVLPSAAGCPAWLVGNDGGAGYYLTVWRGAPPLAPPSELTSEERLARGDDAAIAVRRGELPVARALAEITALAGAHDPYGALAALEIARAVDAFADDAVRPAWAAWLAGRFADQLSHPALVRVRSAADYLAVGQAVELARGAIEPAAAAAARTELERRPAADRRRRRIQLTAARDAGVLFDDVLRDAGAARTDAARDAALDDLGAFPAALAPRIVGLLVGRWSADRVWPALAEMLARSEARSAAWRAIRDRFPAVVEALGRAGARDALAALAALCDPTARAELAAVAAPKLAAIDDGRRVLDRTLATIDRCVTRRAATGDLAAAVAAAGP